MTRRRRPPHRRWPNVLPWALGLVVTGSLAWGLTPSPEAPPGPPLGRQVTLAPPVDPLPTYEPEEEPSSRTSKTPTDAASPDKPARPAKQHRHRPAATPHTSAADPTKTATAKPKSSPSSARPSTPAHTATTPSTPSATNAPSASPDQSPPPSSSPSTASPASDPPAATTPAATSQEQQAAAAMASADVVGGQGCTLSAVGTPDLSLIPPGASYTSSTVNGYTCINW